VPRPGHIRWDPRAKEAVGSAALAPSPPQQFELPPALQSRTLTRSTDGHDPNELVRAKQLSREADARALASGEKTREQLRAENTLVSVSYDELVIDFSHCSPGSLR